MRNTLHAVRNIVIPLVIFGCVALSILGNAPHPYYRMVKTDLQKAVLAGDAKKVNALLAKGADINQKTEEGPQLSPLHLAVGMNNFGMVRLLLDKGARVNITDKFGNTPLHCLMNRVAIPEDAMVKLLVSKGADINAENIQKKTPLYYAAAEARPKTLVFMIKKGASVNHVNSEGRTPLHNAVYYENVENVKKLIANGANASVKDSDGDTPLDMVNEMNTKYRAQHRPMEEYKARLAKLRAALTWQPGQ